MVDFPQLLPEQLLKIRAIRDKYETLTQAQKDFLDSLAEVPKPLESDVVLQLGQLYRIVKELEELPGNHDRNIYAIELDNRVEG